MSVQRAGRRKVLMQKRNLLFLAVLAFCLPFMLCTRTDLEQPRPKLWAAISVSDPLFQEGWTKELMLHFTLVNDGDAVINPQVKSWKIMVNGVELKDSGFISGFIFGNGPRGAGSEALPPGDNLRFGYALGEYFGKPGIYTVSWKGNGFETLPIVFRVMPHKAA